MRIRLTRRGQIVLAVVLLLAVASAAGLAIGVVAGDQVPQRTDTVLVEPGQTLWGIANEVEADADVREVVRRIVELNGLQEGETLSPGQRLRVPAAESTDSGPTRRPS